MEVGNMDHGGEAARPTMTLESTDLAVASAAEGGEVHMSTGTLHGQLAAAAARRDSFQPRAAAYHNSTVFTRLVCSVPVPLFHREPGPGVAYANIVVFWRQTGPVGVVLVGHLTGGVMLVHDNYYGSSALQHRQGARLRVVLADLLPASGAVYSGDYALQPRPGAGHGEELVDIHPDDDGLGVVFVNLLPGGGGAVHDDYGYYPWQALTGAGRGEVFVGTFAQQTLQGTGRADGIGGMLRGPNLGAEHDRTGTLADDLGAVYDDPGMAFQHLRRLLAFAGIGACSVAVNGLATGPGSPAVALYHFALLLGGLFLVILLVLCV